MGTFDSHPGTICICIDDVTEDSIIGRLYHRYSSTPVNFHNYLQMALKAERIFSDAGAPVAFLKERTFNEKDIHKSRKHIAGRAPKLCELNDLIDNNGEKATFIINVMYRQHASWQGRITWMEGQKGYSFRSVLELIKLIDSVVVKPEFRLEQSADKERFI